MRMHLIRRSWLLLFALSIAVPRAEAAENSSIRFNRDIRPILSENCFACHGPDQKQRKAKLRLDTEEGLYSKREDSTIVVPGKSSESELFRRVTAADPEDRMPPASADKELTPRQIELLRQWIDSGAKWEGHWAFIPPDRPSLPEVQRADWPKNGIDYFILQKLEAEGLQPSPEADRARLIRRLSFDLTGLPPTLAEIDAFLADESPRAYEKLVDRLLASPRYGERMALHWLDLARYADTHGYHLDAGRDMWKWREWVIDAFNRNQPFDEFTVEQIAGDLLPNATLTQKLATGFNRNTMINFEGGAIPEEYLTQYIIDRVNTTATVFLGLTMACAQCHDHKYDPITQKDYYRFYAYFNAVPENGLDGRNGNAPPLIYLPTPEQEKQLKELEAALRSAENELQQALPGIDEAQLAWEKAFAESDGPRWTVLNLKEVVSEGGSTLTRQEDGSVLAGGTNPQKDVYVLKARIAETNVAAVQLEALTDPSLVANGPGRAENSNFVLDEIRLEIAPIDMLEKVQKVKWRSASADYSQRGYEIGKAIDGRAETGWAVDGNKRHSDAVAWLVTEEPFGFPGGTELTFRLEFGGSFPQHGIGRVRLSVATGKIGESFPPLEIQRALATAASERDSKQAAALKKYFRENVSEEYRERSGAIATLKKSLDELKKSIPTSMVMEQMENPRDTFVLMRGQYNQPGERVTPGVPASLPDLPEDAPPNRLALAQWLVDPENPLMARVTVNRFWAMIMGTGLVKTANDFGSQGEWPTHPELLDWLATEFMDNGWDVKALLKLIVTSATYRQSSALTPELLEKDPYNRLYARGPRFRLQAELIRDNALALSGLLVERIGGPSVFPYQPPGLWEELSSRKDSKNWSAQFYVQSHGADLYRRGMYTFWKRTSPPPSLQAFDAPDRETCVVQRDRTSTPLQALVLMNDPTFVEAARKFAERMMLEGGSSAAGRIRFAFRSATGRMPSQAEVELLADLYKKQLGRFRADPGGALELLQVGEFPRNEALDPAELAAWTAVASTILNLDETITKS